MKSQPFVTKQERDLEVMLGNNFKKSSQCTTAVQVTNFIPASLQKGIENKTARIILAQTV